MATNPQAAAAAASARAGQSVAVRYVDRPECVETFADCVHNLFFDGQTLRIEFGVTHLDEVKQDTPLTARRYPACRLVLSPSGALELIERIRQVAAALAQSGAIRAPAKAAGSE